MARLLLPGTLAASWIFVLFAGIVGGWPGWSAGRPPQSPSTKLQGTWSRKAPLLTKRAEVGVAALDGKVYVVGGATPCLQASPLNQEYYLAADRWRDRAPLPDGLSHPGVAGLNHKLYAIGGFSGGGVHEGASSIVFSNTTPRPTTAGNCRRSAALVARWAWRQLAAKSTRSEDAGSTK